MVTQVQMQFVQTPNNSSLTKLDVQEWYRELNIFAKSPIMIR